MPPPSPPRPGRRTSGRKRPPSALPSKPRHGLPLRKPPGSLPPAKALEAQCAEARAALPAADREEARRALSGLENERCALRAGMDAAASALARARQDYAAAEAAVTALTAQQTEADEAADLPALESQRDALTARRTALAAQEKALTARLLPNRKAADLYRQHAAARAELERRWQWVNALASTAGGTLSSKQKIRLEAYIQMNYLDAILVHANTRLMQMTAGQYELERVGAENQRSQSGLDLGVIDHYNGTRRSVKTLSGGESFKASLALALGLSDEVQSAAGGIRLDTLFLDEGFGSLDDESLEQAIRVLAGLTEGDRLVGIISHVAALKERIDKQVVVKRPAAGEHSGGHCVTAFLLFLIACLLRAASFRKSFACSGGRGAFLPFLFCIFLRHLQLNAVCFIKSQPF